MLHYSTTPRSDCCSFEPQATRILLRPPGLLRLQQNAWKRHGSNAIFKKAPNISLTKIPSRWGSVFPMKDPAPAIPYWRFPLQAFMPSTGADALLARFKSWKNRLFIHALPSKEQRSSSYTGNPGVGHPNLCRRALKQALFGPLFDAFPFRANSRGSSWLRTWIIAMRRLPIHVQCDRLWIKRSRDVVQWGCKYSCKSKLQPSKLEFSESRNHIEIVALSRVTPAGHTYS